MLFRWTKKFWNSKGTHWCPVAGVASAAMLGCAIAGFELVTGAETQSFEGKIQRLTTAPRGEIDGAILEDGTWLHWPPHLENRFSNAVKAGDKVRATGRTEIGPEGDKRFEIESLTNSSTNAKVDNPDFGYGPPRPPRRPGRRLRPDFGRGRDLDQSRAETTEVKGKVTRMTTAPRGEVDGAMLQDGTWLHWPPHLADLFSKLVKEGENVRAAGRNEVGPAGDSQFEIKTLTNLASNQSAENPDYDNRPLPGPGGRPRGPLGENGNRAAQDSTPREGTISRMTTAPKGEIDGAVLDDGTVLHWPPHLQTQFQDVVKVGDRVRANGQMQAMPAGDTHFEVSSLTNLRTNRTVDNPDGTAVGRRPLQPVELNGESAVEARFRDLEEQIRQLRSELAKLRQN